MKARIRDQGARDEIRAHIRKAARTLANERARNEQEERDRRPFGSLLDIQPNKRARREIIRL